MPDVELGELGNCRYRRDIVVRQPVPGMRLDPVLHRQRSHVGDAAQLRGLHLPRGVSVFAGVKFDHGHAQAQRGFDLARIGGDEQAHADARVGQPGHDRGEAVVLARGIEPAFGGALFAPFGDDARGVGFVAQGDLDHLVGRSHLEVERQVGRGLDPREILVADVAAILTQMRGDPVAADACDDLRGAHRIGMLAASCIADRGDMIDVHAKAEPR